MIKLKKLTCICIIASVWSSSVFARASKTNGYRQNENICYRKREKQCETVWAKLTACSRHEWNEISPTTAQIDCLPSPTDFEVGRVAFDGTNYYIFIFDTIRSPKPCEWLWNFTNWKVITIRHHHFRLRKCYFGVLALKRKQGDFSKQRWHGFGLRIVSNIM